MASQELWLERARPKEKLEANENLAEPKSMTNMRSHELGPAKESIAVRRAESWSFESWKSAHKKWHMEADADFSE